MERPPLPQDRNPMLTEGRSPVHEILVERRCLGQTELKVKPGQVGTSNATKAENLGTLDYAHLRVPLPKDLTGSGIFQKGQNRKWPEAYFLMRRSSDGFISATGMFKAAFPYAQVEEETAEKEYIKSLSEASSEEVAGNVWIDPGRALELADEYGITLWIAALLDPEPITHGTSDSKRLIKSPPAYKMKDMANGIGRTPDKGAAGKRSTRGTRSMRSESPTSTRPKATPRTRRTAKTPRKGRGEDLASVDENASSQGEPVNGTKGDSVTVEVENTVIPDAKGEETTETTKVNVTMPSDNPDLHLDDPKKAMEVARQMTERAKEIGEPSAAGRKGKRKAEEMITSDDEVGLEGPASRAAKKVKPTELELRKERIRRRALTGLVATLAVGAVFPSIASFMGFLA
ncbi:bouquet formation 4-like [Lecanosticta acicola]|uniref:Bouquet formation 4-like n=1 Tax=Lecanosticta acicola TaxID=111012 RepID=A0AAI9E977_9PEZI|nr:bouquet formation 4-like [Lecanosticta acicola]